MSTSGPTTIAGLAFSLYRTVIHRRYLYHVHSFATTAPVLEGIITPYLRSEFTSFPLHYELYSTLNKLLLHKITNTVPTPS